MGLCHGLTSPTALRSPPSITTCTAVTGSCASVRRAPVCPTGARDAGSRESSQSQHLTPKPRMNSEQHTVQVMAGGSVPCITQAPGLSGVILVAASLAGQLGPV